MAGRHQVPLRTFLWEYLGYPEDETAERRRILYAIVVLRLGFGLFFLLYGWGAVFGASAEAMAVRLGDPARLGLSGAAADTTLFILGCTELGIGALLLFGAFTRVSAVTGTLLLLLYLLLGDRSLFAAQAVGSPGGVMALVAGLLLLYVAGLVVLVIAGSPFLSADRALDKLEEEERDRAPAVLPRLAERSSWIMRAGGLVAFVWVIVARPPVELPAGTITSDLFTIMCLLSLGLSIAFPPTAVAAAIGLFVWSLGRGDGALVVLTMPALFVAVALTLCWLPQRRIPVRSATPVSIQET